MKYTHIFFDLDGTVTNSAPGITHSVQYALEKCERPVPPAEELLCFIGPSLMYSFSNFCAMPHDEATRAVALYREYYQRGAMFECEIYEGIEELLRSLNDAGIVCVLATCKPHIYANQILRHFGLDKYFAFVSGPELDGTRDGKDEVIDYAMKHLSITDPRKILMVGDRESDILGALKNGVPAAGVLWGFGSEEELKSSPAVAVFKHAKALADFILG